MTAVPFSTERCYACDGVAVGVRDRRLEGGMMEAACSRHADPTIKAYAACMFCSGARPTRMEGDNFAHKHCQEEAAR